MSSLMLSFIVPNSSACNENYAKMKKVTIQETVSENDVLNSQEIKDMNNEINLAIEEANQKISKLSTIDDKMEWFISYKNVLNEYAYILDPPENIYDYFTSEELDMLFCVVQAETGDECSFEQKANVASIIFNRINHKSFENEMFAVLTKDQFQPVNDGRYKEVEVSEVTILACEYSFMFGDTTNGCLFFDSNKRLKYEFVYSDGAHNFYK